MSRNAPGRYGLTVLSLHWLVAISVIATFAIGKWLETLGYYDPWAPTALWLHRTIGVLAFILFAAKLIRLWFDRKPPLEKGLSRFERVAAVATHHTLALLVLLIPVTGYLMSTSTGDPVPLIWGIEIPATIRLSNTVRDVVIGVHIVLAHALMGLVVIHAAAAIKHQFFDGGHTLQRMLPGRKPLE